MSYSCHADARARFGSLLASFARWPRPFRRPPREQPVAEARIARYLAGGRIPWSAGYAEHKIRTIEAALADRTLLQAFRDGGALPAGYGWRLDERIVEYPWVFARAERWGQRIMDAGSTLNRALFLAHPAIASRELVVYDLAHRTMHALPRISYITGDLRHMVLGDGVVDVIVCISTLEHIGLDNTRLYTADQRYREDREDDFQVAVKEFRRVLAPGGTLLVTVPFGRRANLGWLQQFDRARVDEIVAVFGGEVRDASYFKYEATGWIRSTAEACADCEYFDVHRGGGWDVDFAAAARAVACLEISRAVEPVWMHVGMAAEPDRGAVPRPRRHGNREC
jgi:hypothetical protein